MEEVSFRSGAAALGGVLAAAGAAITLAVVLGGPGDAVASAPAFAPCPPRWRPRRRCPPPPRRRPPRGPAGRRSPRPWPETTGRRGPRPGHRPPGAPRRRRCPAAPQRRVRLTGCGCPATRTSRGSPAGGAGRAGAGRRPHGPGACCRVTAGVDRRACPDHRPRAARRVLRPRLLVFLRSRNIPVAGDPRPHPVRLLGYGVDVPAMSPQVRVAKQPASFGARLPASDATAVTALVIA